MVTGICSEAVVKFTRRPASEGKGGGISGGVNGGTDGGIREGIERHGVDGIPMKVYSPEKTLADCFKYRNKIGLDVVLEALKFYRQRKRLKVDELMRYARVCRVEKVMRPYLEATL